MDIYCWGNYKGRYIITNDSDKKEFSIWRRTME